MSISDKIIRTVDLQKGSLPHRLGRLFATGETKGHEFQISVYDGGTPVDLTGATVLGYFTRSDGSSKEVEGGTVSGNTCTISLSAACYTRSGYFEFDIRLTKDGITHTIYYATGYMVTSYNEPIDTTPTKMTLDEIQQKIVDLKTQAKAVEDSIPEDYTELTEHVDFLTDENYEAKSGNDVFEIGGINYSSGSLTNATVRFRTKDYLDGSIGVRANDGYKYCVFAYRKTANKQYLGAWTGTGFSTNASDAKIVTGSVALSSLGDYYYKVVGMRPNVSEDVTTEDFDKVEILYGTKATNADRDALGIALGNANDFAVTNFANGARGKQDGYSYVVNNYTVIGTTNASICVSGNPNLKPSNLAFASLSDDYYTIPLIAGKTYTLVAFVTGQTGVGNISFYMANKTDKAEIAQCTYNIVPADVHDKIVMNSFTVPTDDMYALKVYIRSQEDKVVKVAIYPQDCLYQRIAALNSSLTELTSQFELLTDDAYDTVTGSADTFEIGRVVFLDGTINREEAASLKRFVTTELWDGATTAIRVKDGYKAYIYGYLKNSENAYAGAWSINDDFIKSNSSNIRVITGSYSLTQCGADYLYRIVGERLDGANTTADDFDGIDILTAKRNDGKKIDYSLYKTIDQSENFTQDFYINLSNEIGTEVDLTPVPFTDQSYVILPCKAGDKFVITGSTSTNARSWGFTDTEYVLKRVALGNTGSPSRGRELIAREDGYFIANHNVTSDIGYSLIATQLIKAASQDDIAALNDTLTAKDAEIEAEIADLTAGKLESTGDSTDRTAEIRAKLNANGYCELGNGEFVVANLEMPAGTELRGQGYATVLKLDTSLTSGAAVVAKNRCTVRDLAITGAESLVIDSDSTAGNRHGIKMDAYGDIDVRISNVRINRFDGYGIYVRGFGMSTSVIKYVQCNVSDCFIDHCFTGIYVGGLANNAVFTNCHCVNGYYAVYATTRCQFADCVFMNNLMGVYVVGKGPSFIGCTFHDEGSTVNTYALVAQNVTQFPMTLTGCRFYGCGALEITGTSGSSVALMALFSGCAFGGMTLPIVCNYAAGILFDGCLFGEDVTASGNISESSTGLVKLKNCYRTTTGALLER